MPLWVSETELSSTYLHSWDFVILGDGGGSGSWKCVCLGFVALSKEAGENRPGDDKNLPHQGWGSHWILNNVVFLCNPNVQSLWAGGEQGEPWAEVRGRTRPVCWRTTRVRDRLGGEGVCRGLGKMGRNTSKASGGERSLKELHSCVAVCRVLVIGFWFCFSFMVLFLRMRSYKVVCKRVKDALQSNSKF